VNDKSEVVGCPVGLSDHSEVVGYPVGLSDQSEVVGCPQRQYDQSEAGSVHSDCPISLRPGLSIGTL
jgi:hypothetical protein